MSFKGLLFIYKIDCLRRVFGCRLETRIHLAVNKLPDDVRVMLLVNSLLNSNSVPLSALLINYLLGCSDSQLEKEAPRCFQWVKRKQLEG